MSTTAERFFRNKTAAAATLVIGLIAVVAVAGPFLYPHDPFAVLAKPFEPPFGTYPLGTDVLGRDVAAGLIYGVSRMFSVFAAQIRFDVDAFTNFDEARQWLEERSGQRAGGGDIGE